MVTDELRALISILLLGWMGLLHAAPAREPFASVTGNRLFRAGSDVGTWLTHGVQTGCSQGNLSSSRRSNLDKPDTLRTDQALE
jgi:hypothetical protein